MANCRSDSSIHLPALLMRTCASRSGTCLMQTMIFIEGMTPAYDGSALTVLAGGSARAVSWAMSNSCGAVPLVAESASRNMVLQKGQAVAMVEAPVATSSLARV